jgi:hypothetical protein
MTTPSSQTGTQPRPGTPGPSAQPRTPAQALHAAAAFLESAGQRSGVIATCSGAGIRILITEPYADPATRQAILTRLARLIGGTVRQEDEHDYPAANLHTAGAISGLPAVVVTGLQVQRTQPRTRTGRPLANAPGGLITAVRGKLPDGWRWMTELDPQPSPAADAAPPAAPAPEPHRDCPLLAHGARQPAGPRGHAPAVQPARPSDTAGRTQAQPSC